MKAAYLINGKIEVGELPDPEPGPGQVLVRTHSCGMCASDLHLAHHGAALVEWSHQHDGPFSVDLSSPLVPGHEFVGEVVDYGKDCTRSVKKGVRVTSQPLVMKPGGFDIVGISNDMPGGFGELMILEEQLLKPIPESLDGDLAAMAEPVSVGLYYVRAAKLAREDIPLIVGCGAIGLAVILGLRHGGHRPIIASDFSPERRAMALSMGADIVVDPAQQSPYEQHPDASGAPNVIFECVGVPGVMDQIVRRCAPGARILVAGWCLETDHMLTACAHLKGLTLQYGGGPQSLDFDLATKLLIAGSIDPTPWFGEKIGLGNVAEQLEKIADPANPIRTLVDPRLL